VLLIRSRTLEVGGTLENGRKSHLERRLNATASIYSQSTSHKGYLYIRAMVVSQFLARKIRINLNRNKKNGKGAERQR
jgi:hypothetical protein